MGFWSDFFKAPNIEMYEDKNNGITVMRMIQPILVIQNSKML